MAVAKGGRHTPWINDADGHRQHKAHGVFGSKRGWHIKSGDAASSNWREPNVSTDADGPDFAVSLIPAHRTALEVTDFTTVKDCRLTSLSSHSEEKRQREETR